MIEEEYKFEIMKMDNAREQQLIDLPVFIDKMRILAKRILSTLLTWEILELEQ